jgi:hypothetical protein
MKRRQLMTWMGGAVLMSFWQAHDGHAQSPSPSQSQSQSSLPDWLTEAARRMDNAVVIRGDFEQIKAIKGFKKPLLSRGRFLIARGQGIQWLTLEPFPSTLVVTRERLMTVTEGGVQQMDARQEPGLRAVNELLMAVLGGDLRALGKRFQVDGALQGSQGWRMSLVPKDEALRRFIARIDMEGDRHVQQVRLTEGSGDESRIRFAHHSSTSLTQAEAARFN